MHLAARRGSVLVTALWLVTLLAVVAVALAGTVATETQLVRCYRARAQARAWAKAGVWLGLQRLAQVSESSLVRPWFEPWKLALPTERAGASPWRGAMTITVADEERRLNVHRLGEPFLRRVVMQLAEQVEEMAPLVQAIDAVIQHPLTALEEWLALPGMAPARYRRIEPFFSTALEPGSAVDINTADVRLLGAFFDASGHPGLAARIAAYRVDGRGAWFAQLRPEILVDGAPLDPVVESALNDVLIGPYGAWLDARAATFRLTVRVEIVRPLVRYRIEAIVRRRSDASSEAGAEAWRVLSWREG